MIEHEFMRIVHVMTAIIRNLGWLLDLSIREGRLVLDFHSS
jgi:hypothetical protein